MDSKPTIFCVDDNQTNLKLLKKALRRYQCVLLESGEACLEAIDASPPDLILLDVMMPGGIDGLETCRKIRALPENKDISVIFLSAKQSLDDKLEGYSVGGDDYIGKPFAMEELLAKVQTALSRKEQLDGFRKEMDESAQTAREMLTSMGENSIVVNFLQNTLSCNSYKSLADAMIQAHQSLGLNIVLEIKEEDGCQMYSAPNTGSPLEKSVFEFVKSKGRLVSFGERTALNYSQISVIIRNMPDNDSAEYGRTKDLVALIAKGANAKIKAIQQEIQIKNKFAMLVEFMEEMKGMLGQLDQTYENHQQSTEKILARVGDELEGSFMKLGLYEFQEEEQRRIVEMAENELRSNNDDFTSVHKQFATMHRQIDTVLEHTFNAMKHDEEDSESEFEEMVSLF